MQSPEEGSTFYDQPTDAMSNASSSSSSSSEDEIDQSMTDDRAIEIIKQRGLGHFGPPPKPPGPVFKPPSRTSESSVGAGVEEEGDTLLDDEESTNGNDEDGADLGPSDLMAIKRVGERLWKENPVRTIPAPRPRSSTIPSHARTGEDDTSTPGSSESRSLESSNLGLSAIRRVAQRAMAEKPLENLADRTQSPSTAGSSGLLDETAVTESISAEDSSARVNPETEDEAVEPQVPQEGPERETNKAHNIPTSDAGENRASAERNGQEERSGTPATSAKSAATSRYRSHGIAASTPSANAVDPEFGISALTVVSSGNSTMQGSINDASRRRRLDLINTITEDTSSRASIQKRLTFDSDQSSSTGADGSVTHTLSWNNDGAYAQGQNQSKEPSVPDGPVADQPAESTTTTVAEDAGGVDEEENGDEETADEHESLPEDEDNLMGSEEALEGASGGLPMIQEGENEEEGEQEEQGEAEGEEEEHGEAEGEEEEEEQREEEEKEQREEEGEEGEQQADDYPSDGEAVGEEGPGEPQASTNQSSEVSASSATVEEIFLNRCLAASNYAKEQNLKVETVTAKDCLGAQNRPPAKMQTLKPIDLQPVVVLKASDRAAAEEHKARKALEENQRKRLEEAQGANSDNSSAASDNRYDPSKRFVKHRKNTTGSSGTSMKKHPSEIYSSVLSYVHKTSMSSSQNSRTGQSSQSQTDREPISQRTTLPSIQEPEGSEGPSSQQSQHPASDLPDVVTGGPVSSEHRSSEPQQRRDSTQKKTPIESSSPRPSRNGNKTLPSSTAARKVDQTAVGSTESLFPQGARTIVGSTESLFPQGARTIGGSAESLFPQGARTIAGSAESIFPQGARTIAGSAESLFSHEARTMVGSTESLIPADTRAPTPRRSDELSEGPATNQARSEEASSGERGGDPRQSDATGPQVVDETRVNDRRRSSKASSEISRVLADDQPLARSSSRTTPSRQSQGFKSSRLISPSSSLVRRSLYAERSSDREVLETEADRTRRSVKKRKYDKLRQLAEARRKSLILSDESSEDEEFNRTAPRKKSKSGATEREKQEVQPKDRQSDQRNISKTRAAVVSSSEGADGGAGKAQSSSFRSTSSSVGQSKPANTPLASTPPRPPVTDSPKDKNDGSVRASPRASSRTFTKPNVSSDTRDQFVVPAADATRLVSPARSDTSVATIPLNRPRVSTQKSPSSRKAVGSPGCSAIQSPSQHEDQQGSQSDMEVDENEPSNAVPSPLSIPSPAQSRDSSRSSDAIESPASNIRSRLSHLEKSAERSSLNKTSPRKRMASVPVNTAKSPKSVTKDFGKEDKGKPEGASGMSYTRKRVAEVREEIENYFRSYKETEEAEAQDDDEAVPTDSRRTSHRIAKDHHSNLNGRKSLQQNGNLSEAEEQEIDSATAPRRSPRKSAPRVSETSSSGRESQRQRLEAAINESRSAREAAVSSPIRQTAPSEKSTSRRSNLLHQSRQTSAIGKDQHQVQEGVSAEDDLELENRTTSRRETDSREVNKSASRGREKPAEQSANVTKRTTQGDTTTTRGPSTTAEPPLVNLSRRTRRSRLEEEMEVQQESSDYMEQEEAVYSQTRKSTTPIKERSRASEKSKATDPARKSTRGKRKGESLQAPERVAVEVPDEPVPGTSGTSKFDRLQASISQSTKKSSARPAARVSVVATKVKTAAASGKGKAKAKKKTLEAIMSNKNLVSKQLVRWKCEALKISISNSEIDRLTAYLNKEVEKMLDKLQRKTLRDYGMFSFRELESALRAHNLIHGVKNELLVHLAQILTPWDYQAAEGVLIPKGRDHDT